MTELQHVKKKLKALQEAVQKDVAEEFELQQKNAACRVLETGACAEMDGCRVSVVNGVERCLAKADPTDLDLERVVEHVKAGEHAFVDGELARSPSRLAMMEVLRTLRDLMGKDFEVHGDSAAAKKRTADLKKLEKQFGNAHVLVAEGSPDLGGGDGGGGVVDSPATEDLNESFHKGTVSFSDELKALLTAYAEKGGVKNMDRFKKFLQAVLVFYRTADPPYRPVMDRILKEVLAQGPLRPKDTDLGERWGVSCRGIRCRRILGSFGDGDYCRQWPCPLR